MSSRYHEVYAAWKRDPEAFWAEAAREIDWYKPWDKVFDPDAGDYGRWFTGAECNTAWNCLDRHVERGRAEQTALIYDSPITGDDARLHLCRAARRGGDARRRAAGPRRRQGRPRHHLYADGAGGGDRHARLRAHRRHPFRRVRRLRRAGARHPHRRRASRSSSSRPPAASSPAASSPTSRCSTRRSSSRRHKPQYGADPAAAAMSQATLRRRPRPRLGERGRRRQGARPRGRLRAGRRHRSALHPLHLRHDRPAQGRRARQWRPHGRAEMDDVEPLRRQARRDVLGGLRRRLGGRPFLHRLRAAAARLHERSCSRASRSARPTPAPSGASSPSTASPRCSPRRPPSAPSRRRTPRASTSAATICRASARCSWPASAPTPRPSNGRESEAEGAGLRPLVADRDRLADRRQSRSGSACCR